MGTPSNINTMSLTLMVSPLINMARFTSSTVCLLPTTWNLCALSSPKLFTMNDTDLCCM